MDGLPPPPPPILTQEVRIVDAAGHIRLLLSAKSGTPVFRMLMPDGGTAAEIALDPEGRPKVVLNNPAAKGPTAALEIDDKGAHVKFDRPGGASSYLYLNDQGGSGVVLIDGAGVRRLEANVAANGSVTVDRNDATPRP